MYLKFKIVMSKLCTQYKNEAMHMCTKNSVYDILILSVWRGIETGKAKMFLVSTTDTISDSTLYFFLSSFFRVLSRSFLPPCNLRS